MDKEDEIKVVFDSRVEDFPAVEREIKKDGFLEVKFEVWIRRHRSMWTPLGKDALVAYRVHSVEEFKKILALLPGVCK